MDNNSFREFPTVVSFEGEHPEMLIGKQADNYPLVADESMAPSDHARDTRTWD